MTGVGGILDVRQGADVLHDLLDFLFARQGEALGVFGPAAVAAADELEPLHVGGAEEGFDGLGRDGCEGGRRPLGGVGGLGDEFGGDAVDEVRVASEFFG